MDGTVCVFYDDKETCLIRQPDGWLHGIILFETNQNSICLGGTIALQLWYKQLMIIKLRIYKQPTKRIVNIKCFNKTIINFDQFVWNFQDIN